MRRFFRFLCGSLLGVFLQVVSVDAQVILGPSLYDPNQWYGQSSSPPCVVTNGATVSVNALSCVTSPGAGGVDLNTITLTQNSVFAFPTGLPPNGDFKFGFRINHGTGPYVATFASGYQFPIASLTNGQPVLSTSGTDYVWCVSEEGFPPTQVDCSASMLAMTPVDLPLDVVGSATFAYGLRRLRTGYAGSAVNVRRASGSPSTTDIGFDAHGNFDAATFATFCSGTTCFLAIWYDQSGNGFNCVQSTSANQPQVVLSSLGGRASLQTTGNAGQMYCSVSANSMLDFTGSGHTVLYVPQYTATTDGGGTGGGRGDSLGVVAHVNPSGFFPGWSVDAGDTGRAGSTFVFTSNGSTATQDGSSTHLTAINDGNPHLAGWTFSSGTVVIHQDTSTYTSSVTFDTPATTGLPMVVLAGGDSPIDGFFSGNLAEVYGWSTTLTSAQINTIQSGVALYY